jgi:hypothetical protein
LEDINLKNLLDNYEKQVEALRQSELNEQQMKRSNEELFANITDNIIEPEMEEIKSIIEARKHICNFIIRKDLGIIKMEIKKGPLLPITTSTTIIYLLDFRKEKMHKFVTPDLSNNRVDFTVEQFSRLTAEDIRNHVVEAIRRTGTFSIQK